MKRLWRHAVVFGVLLLVGLSGCSIQDQIDKLTTRDITISSTIYNGELSRTSQTVPLVDTTRINSGETYQAEPITTFDIEDFVAAYNEGLPLTDAYFTGNLKNPTDAEMFMEFHLAAINRYGEGDPVYIGTLFVPPHANLELERGFGFVDDPADVQTQVQQFIAQQKGQSFVQAIFAAPEGQGGYLNVNDFRLHVTPTYQREDNFSGSLLSGYADKVKSIGKVELVGSIANYGDTDLYFVALVGGEGGDPDFANDIVIEGVVHPQKTVPVGEMLVDGGLAHLKDKLNDVVDGYHVQGYLFMTSETEVKAQVNSLKIRARVRVGL